VLTVYMGEWYRAGKELARGGDRNKWFGEGRKAMVRLKKRAKGNQGDQVKRTPQRYEVLTPIALIEENYRNRKKRDPTNIQTTKIWPWEWEYGERVGE